MSPPSPCVRHPEAAASQGRCTVATEKQHQKWSFRGFPPRPEQAEGLTSQSAGGEPPLAQRETWSWKEQETRTVDKMANEFPGGMNGC
jgi:hypothetical protein